MIGRMRRVNPGGPSSLIALMGRLQACSADGGATWELRLLHRGVEFSTRRALLQIELAALASNRIEPKPWLWSWVGIEPVRQTTVRLRGPERPTVDELAPLAEEALRACQTERGSLARIDRFEVWLGDRETGRPLALAATATGRDWALAIPHVRPWQCLPPHLQTPETWALQTRVNGRLNRCERPGRYRFVVRLYERTAKGAVRHGPDGTTGRLRRGILPEGSLAEPWESQRIAVLNRLKTAEPRLGDAGLMVRPSIASAADRPARMRLGSTSALSPSAPTGSGPEPMAATG